ncbi:hypothetical protein WMY93_011261 [Mugilogobius chulae]|uniref:Agouti-signaling protein n=1 Tax=Mugilogobius chulae TaxID=88201 RepID=A0AAW0P236_9GOBI
MNSNFFWRLEQKSSIRTLDNVCYSSLMLVSAPQYLVSKAVVLNLGVGTPVGVKMNVFLLLSCALLAATEYFPSSAHMVHMVLDSSLSTNQVVVSPEPGWARSACGPIAPQLPKVKKNKRTKKQKKNKYGVRKRPPPPPPANCVPAGSSCKSANSVCCDLCAFCQCRLFRTVCFCRMGNPRC